MGIRRRSQTRLFARACRWAVVAAAISIQHSEFRTPHSAEVAAADAQQPVLARFVDEGETGSAVWWLARAEREVGPWGNDHRQADALATIAEVLADGDQIEAAVALAGRIKVGSIMFGVRKQIVAAYARAGRLDDARAMARVSDEPDGRAEPGAYCELTGQIAISLAGKGRIEEAEKVLAGLDDPPADWPLRWEPPNSLPSIKARVHAALGAACAKAGRRDEYRQHIDKAEALAAGIPGDVNQMWAELGSSSRPPGGPGDEPGVDPMGGIYKSFAVRSIVVAQAGAGDFEAARKALELIPAGRHRDAIARELVEMLARGGALQEARIGQEARTVADAIETADQRELAELALWLGYMEAREKSSRPKPPSERITSADCRMLAEVCLGLAEGEGEGGSGEAGNLEALVARAAAAAGLQAAQPELQARGLGDAPRLPAVPQPRPATYRAVARILAGVPGDHDQLLRWIEAIPEGEARFNAFVGVGEQRLEDGR